MRLIDADELMKRIDDSARNDGLNLTDYRKIIRWVAKAPIIDAVEVVRCKECKHWGTGYGGETEHVKVCEFANYMVGENGYCVYGERRDENAI